jgi:hypothetical protein
MLPHPPCTGYRPEFWSSPQQILNAQACLSLSTAAAPSGSTASLELSLDSPADQRPAALQWTFRYTLSAIRSFTVDDGPVVTAAGKTVMCTPNAAGYMCIAVGAANTTTIANGVVARITAVLSPEAGNAGIDLVNLLAASPEGYFIPLVARSGMVTTANVSPDRRLRPPLRRTLRSRCLSKTE